MIKKLVYRLKWHIAPYIYLSAPVHIDLELNNTCNQKCVMCWHSLPELPFKRQIIIDEWKYIEYIKSAGVSSVKFNWRGEPLLRPAELFYVSRELKTHGVHTMINTNGVLLLTFPPLALPLLNDALDEIIISIDSLDIDTYRKIHGEDFNTRMLILKLIQLKLHPKIVLNFHENDFNRDELTKNIDMYREIFPFKIVHRKTQNRAGAHIGADNSGRTRKKYCPHMMRRLTVAANGKIFPCCVAYNEPADICLGTDIASAWTSEKRLTLIKNYRNGVYTESCKNCTSEDIYT